MQVPRDLSRRMLEAVEEEPVVDVHERLFPESERVRTRLDFITWYLAYAEDDVHIYGLEPEAWTLLRDVKGDPDERWAAMTSFWPHVRTTSAGRVVLRVAWELCGIEDVNERTWKEVSACLWKACQPGFYQETLCRRANVRVTLVDGPVEPEMSSCCARVANYDPLLSLGCREDVEALACQFEARGATLDELDDLVARSVQRDVERGVVAFKLGALPASTDGLSRPWDPSPSSEEIEWALGRVLIRDASETAFEPALHSYLCHRTLEHVASTDRPVLVPVGGAASTALLGLLAGTHTAVRFVGLLNGLDRDGLDVYAALAMARVLPNVSLAMGDLWRIAPHMARRTLRAWLEGVPLHKLFALGGNAQVVEAVSAQAVIVRQQIASLLAEMVTEDELDEGDARLAMRRLLSGNAVDYFRLRACRDLEIVATDFP